MQGGLWFAAPVYLTPTSRSARIPVCVKACPCSFVRSFSMSSITRNIPASEARSDRLLSARSHPLATRESHSSD